MNYLEKIFLVKTEWWRYFLTITLVLIGIGLFSIPHRISILAKAARGEVDTSKIEDITYLFSLFDSNENLVYIMLPFAGGLLFLFLGVKWIHKQSIIDLTTSRKKIDWKRTWFSFLVWSIVVIAFVGIQYLVAPKSFIFNFEAQPFVILCFLAILLIPLQTSFEEYIFRGYLMQGFAKISKNKWFPLIITSAIFGLLHIFNPEVEKLGKIILIYYIGIGLFLGIIALMDGGIELSLGFHAANNLTTVLLVTSDWTALQTHSILKDISEPTIELTVVSPLLILPILLFLLSKKYKWTNWREKLTGKVSKSATEND